MPTFSSTRWDAGVSHPGHRHDPLELDPLEAEVPEDVAGGPLLDDPHAEPLLLPVLHTFGPPPERLCQRPPFVVQGHGWVVIDGLPMRPEILRPEVSKKEALRGD